jgi:glycosyltransferase involved in cell wall biosynthesis
VIAGRLQGEYSRKVLSRAKRLPNVSVIGEVSEDEKISLMRDSYLNITLSRLEALGLAQLEFMSYGVPVVTSGVGGQSWIVKTGETGVVLDGPEDLAGAAAAIEALVKDPLLRDRLGESARVFSSKFYMRTLVKNLVRELRARSLSESNKIASS